jgi:hypothetical protein
VPPSLPEFGILPNFARTWSTDLLYLEHEGNGRLPIKAFTKTHADGSAGPAPPALLSPVFPQVHKPGSLTRGDLVEVKLGHELAASWIGQNIPCDLSRGIGRSYPSNQQEKYRQNQWNRNSLDHFSLLQASCLVAAGSPFKCTTSQMETQSYALANGHDGSRPWIGYNWSLH